MAIVMPGSQVLAMPTSAIISIPNAEHPATVKPTADSAVPPACAPKVLANSGCCIRLFFAELNAFCTLVF